MLTFATSAIINLLVQYYHTNHQIITDDNDCMDELERALQPTDDDSGDGNGHNAMSDNDKKLIQHSIELIKVVTSYDIIDHVIISLFRFVLNV